MASSHTSQRLQVSFDDRRVIADAGLLLPAVLAQRLGLAELIDDNVDLGQAAGRAHVGAKAMTLIASLLAGGDCIEEAGQLRAEGMEEVLGHRVLAPSTLGTFLRSFSESQSRQFERVHELALGRAWKLGLGPGEGPLTIDLDSTICETFGKQKQGAERTYAKVRGYQPFLATSPETGDVLHWRLREGQANPHLGAADFTTETLQKVRRLGAQGSLLVRADSGFYTEEVIWACRDQGAKFSITARKYAPVVAVIKEIPEAAWKPIPWAEGSAELAETAYSAFANSHHGRGQAIPTRLIVRRVQQRERKGQLQLPGVYDYQAFITDCAGPAEELEAEHRRHAVVENEIRELKYDLGLNHLPSGQFAANAVWLALNGLAHNLANWVVRLALDSPQLTVKTARRWLFSVPGRLIRSGRRLRLRLPSYWLWAGKFLKALDRLRQI